MHNRRNKKKNGKDEPKRPEEIVKKDPNSDFNLYYNEEASSLISTSYSEIYDSDEKANIKFFPLFYLFACISTFMIGVTFNCVEKN
jgi:hypothetical protein